MNSRRSIAIDLPQKMLVWEESGVTHLTYNDPAYLASRHGIVGQAKRLEKVANLLGALAAEAAGTAN